MNQKVILVLGAYGGTGQIICSLLLKETDVGLVISGRNKNELTALLVELKKEFPYKKINAIFADATDLNSLTIAFRNVSLVVDATTATKHVLNVANAALQAGADYLDFHFEQKVVAQLAQLKNRIENKGRCFITQAGFHPGLPATFVRYASSYFDELNSAIIGMAMSAKIEKPESVYELVDVLSEYKVEIFKDGKWQLAGWRDFKKIDFGARFGTRICYPLHMEEMRLLPSMFPLRETGVYVAGFNWFIDYFVFPLAFMLFAIKKGAGRHLIAKLLIYGFNNFTSVGQGVSFVLTANGMKKGKHSAIRLLAQHDDAYQFTAIPIVACILQYLDGKFSTPGLWMMGHIVDSDRLLVDMQQMGVQIEEQWPDRATK
jgi:saccharopine dehydrogenase (NAD+, L-lysine-forming)